MVDMFSNRGSSSEDDVVVVPSTPLRSLMLKQPHDSSSGTTKADEDVVAPIDTSDSTVENREDCSLNDDDVVEDIIVRPLKELESLEASPVSAMQAPSSESPESTGPEKGLDDQFQQHAHSTALLEPHSQPSNLSFDLSNLDVIYIGDIDEILLRQTPIKSQDLDSFPHPFLCHGFDPVVQSKTLKDASDSQTQLNLADDACIRSNSDGPAKVPILPCTPLRLSIVHGDPLDVLFLVTRRTVEPDVEIKPTTNLWPDLETMDDAALIELYDTEDDDDSLPGPPQKDTHSVDDRYTSIPSLVSDATFDDAMSTDDILGSLPLASDTPALQEHTSPRSELEDSMAEFLDDILQEATVRYHASPRPAKLTASPVHSIEFRNDMDQFNNADLFLGKKEVPSDLEFLLCSPLEHVLPDVQPTPSVQNIVKTQANDAPLPTRKLASPPRLGRLFHKPPTLEVPQTTGSKHRFLSTPSRPHGSPRHGSKYTVPIQPHLATVERLGEKVRPLPSINDYSMAQCTELLCKELRKASPTNWQPHITTPRAPKFHSSSPRALPQSTEEREREMMEYFKAHPFKAAPIMAAAKVMLSKLSGRTNTTTPRTPLPSRTPRTPSILHTPTSKTPRPGGRKFTFHATPKSSKFHKASLSSKTQ